MKMKIMVRQFICTFISLPTFNKANLPFARHKSFHFVEDENNNDASSAYGYVNDYGEYVIIYKSMFNIQYFNIVLWTSLGLLTVFGVSTYMMLTMPLLPDTLLFGESAKVDIAA